MRSNLRPIAAAIERPSEVLPTPGGPTKQRIERARVRLELAHREELEDAVLDLLDVVVVAVEHAGARASGRGCPRSTSTTGSDGDPLEVGADHAVLGRLRRQALEAPQLALGRLPRVLGQVRLLDLLAQLLRPRPAARRPRRAPPGSPSAAGAGSTRAGPCPSRTGPATGSACRSRSARARARAARRGGAAASCTSRSSSSSCFSSVLIRSAPAIMCASSAGSSRFGDRELQLLGQVRQLLDDLRERRLDVADERLELGRGLDHVGRLVDRARPGTARWRRSRRARRAGRPGRGSAACRPAP